MVEGNPPPVNILKISKKDINMEDNMDQKCGKKLEKLECGKPESESPPTDLSPTLSPQSNALLGPVSFQTFK